ncbi:MAG: spermidine/putrescine transport system substrate-binding protein [Alpinimonas sp.]|jgi:spermidine/putrescine transport system substrate-binding protein
MTERSMPQDPRVQALIKHAMQSKVTRRTLLATAGAGAVAAGLAACAPGASAVITPAADASASDKTLRWANWPLYIDVDDAGAYPTLAAFEEQTGITVEYQEAIPSNEDFYAVVKDQLDLGQDIGYDLMTLTDYFAARMVRRAVVQPIDMAAMPNVKANLSPSLADITYDPGRQFSIPWQSGLTGLGWNNADFPGGMTSVEELWDPLLKGKITLLSSWTDTIGLIMQSQGVDIDTDWGQDEFDAALEVVKKQVSDGQVRAFTGNNYSEEFASGNVIAAMVWSGDLFIMNAEAESEKYGFAVPEMGGYLWSDNFMIPMGSAHKANAEELINYYYDPAVAAQVAAYVNYITPVVGAQEEMMKIDPALASNPLIFPDAATLARSHAYRQLTPEEDSAYSIAFERAQVL